MGISKLHIEKLFGFADTDKLFHGDFDFGAKYGKLANRFFDLGNGKFRAC